MDFLEAFIRGGSHAWNANQLLSKVKNLGGLIGIGNFNHGLSPWAKLDGRILNLAGGVASALEIFIYFGCIRAERTIVGSDSLHIRFDLGFAFQEQFLEHAQWNLVIGAQFHVQASAEFFDSVASAIRHFDERV